MKKVCLVYLLLMGVLRCDAQLSDSSKTLSEVAIHAHRFGQFTTGFKSIQIDSFSKAHFFAQNLGDLLATLTPIHVRTYGFGNIGTASSRGTTAEQTAVLWNGFNIQNPMLGQFDFSLFPIDASDHISVQLGGNGALFGSGAVGGSVILQSLPSKDSGTHLQVNFMQGSFGLNRESIKISTRTKRLETRVQIIRQQADNDFEYVNQLTQSNTRVKLAHAQTEQFITKADLFYTLSKHNHIKLHSLIQQGKRNIAPTLTENISNATQSDRIYRIAAEWNFEKYNHRVSTRTAWFEEYLHYSNPSTAVNSLSEMRTSITEAELTSRWNKYTTSTIGLNHTYNNANAQGFNGKWISQNRSAAFYAIKFNYKRLSIQHTGRNERVDKGGTPYIPGLSAEWRILSNVSFTSNVSKSFRLPSLNERYWLPGGNPNLKSESGWGKELGVLVKLGNQRLHTEINSHVFDRTIENQIVWLMANGNPSPFNVREVHTIGNETQVVLNYFISNQTRIRLTSAVNLTQAKNVRGITADDESKNKYMIYVPRVSQQHAVSFSTAHFVFSYYHTYTGLRFTTSDNAEALQDYQLGTIAFSYKLPIKFLSTSVQAIVNNCWNTTYMVMPNRPMPGRNYQLSINFNI